MKKTQCLAPDEEKIFWFHPEQQQQKKFKYFLFLKKKVAENKPGREYLLGVSADKKGFLKNSNHWHDECKR